MRRNKENIANLVQGEIMFLRTAVRFGEGKPSLSRGYFERGTRVTFETDKEFAEVFRKYYGASLEQYYDKNFEDNKKSNHLSSVKKPV